MEDLQSLSNKHISFFKGSKGTFGYKGSVYFTKGTFFLPKVIYPLQKELLVIRLQYRLYLKSLKIEKQIQFKTK